MYTLYILYIFVCKTIYNFNKNKMNTVTAKKKVIDIRPETFKALSLMAVSEGKSLKSFIEHKLEEITEDFEDYMLYEYLVSNDSSKKELANEEEIASFKTLLNL